MRCALSVLFVPFCLCVGGGIRLPRDFIAVCAVVFFPTLLLSALAPSRLGRRRPGVAVEDRGLKRLPSLHRRPLPNPQPVGRATRTASGCFPARRRRQPIYFSCFCCLCQELRVCMSSLSLTMYVALVCCLRTCVLHCFCFEAARCDTGGESAVPGAHLLANARCGALRKVRQESAGLQERCDAAGDVTTARASVAMSSQSVAQGVFPRARSRAQTQVGW